MKKIYELEKHIGIIEKVLLKNYDNQIGFQLVFGIKDSYWKVSDFIPLIQKNDEIHYQGVRLCKSLLNNKCNINLSNIISREVELLFSENQLIAWYFLGEMENKYAK
jgi:hypothetical protein